MDPISIQGAAAAGWPRGSGSNPADVSVALRQGRVFSGEVLQSFGGGSLLIGVGALRVPARSQTELEPGRRYLFEVVHSGEPIELKIVEGPAAAEGDLVRALRSALGAGAPLGALLEQLAAALTAATSRQRRSAGAPGTSPEQLLGQLESHALAPEEGAQGLREKLSGAGLAFESRLAQLVAHQASQSELAPLARELLAALESEIAAAASKGPASEGAASDPTKLLSRLSQALRDLFASAAGGDPEAGFRAWVRGDAVETLGSSGERALEAAAQRSSPADARALATALDALGAPHWPRWMRTLLVRALGRFEGAAAGDAAAELESLRTDLKALLMSAERVSTDAGLREALARALNGVEADQLLNVARAAVDEPQQWSVPIHEHGRWTTLHLSVSRDGSGASGAGESHARRASIEVEFSRTGPLHADILVEPNAATVRVLAADETVVEFLSARSSELEQTLAFGGAAAHIRVARAPSDQHLHGDAPANSSFFRGRHLLDLEG